jgi:hypothetical protein
MFFFSFLFISCFFIASHATSLPQLNVDGFGWAENLCFDGRGGLFVSELTRGELHRISLCEKDGVATYCDSLHLIGFDNIGGLATSPDGDIIYAAVSYKESDENNKENTVSAIIQTSTDALPNGQQGNWTVIGKTTFKPNGMQLYNDVFYCTEEGGVKGNGQVFTVDLKTGTETVIRDDINADGLWLNADTGHMFIGWVETMKVTVMDVKTNFPLVAFIGDFDAAGAAFKLPVLQILDDLTIAAKGGSSPIDGGINVNDIGSTMLLGADWLGKKVLQFSLDGTVNEPVKVPNGLTLKEITSVRWGKGPGFDENSIYVTEGGGWEGITNRRVLQIPMN